MANTFALILALATLITGIIWCIERFKLAPARNRRVEEARVKTDDQISGKDLARIGEPSPWIETPASFFPILAIVFILRSFIYEPFQIPSGSMMPTLLIGDFILVEKYAYGIKDPITQTTLIETGHPERGDIAVFKYPEDTRIDYIKRVVGLPGDTVRYDGISKVLSIQPACKGENCGVMTPLVYSDVSVSDWTAGIDINNRMTRFYNKLESSYKNVAKLIGQTDLLTRNETLGEVAHAILQAPGSDPRSGVRQWVVPEGHYFMMGDNRDFSSDSRVWGFVPERNLVGKATAIWISFEKQEGEWPTGVRFSRIGGIH
jgi:signal peptidase I